MPSAFDPMDPTTWANQARHDSTRTDSVRPRYPRTQAAIRELVYALDGARHALSALEDSNYFELEIARFEEHTGQPYEVPECLRDMHAPDPDFGRWDDRVSRFRDNLKSAMLFAACAMHNLLLAETAEGVRPPKRRRRARA